MAKLIYTRCMPRLDLERNLQPLWSDGFGVFAANALPQRVDVPLLEKALSVKNAADEDGDTGLMTS